MKKRRPSERSRVVGAETHLDGRAFGEGRYTGRVSEEHGTPEIGQDRERVRDVVDATLVGAGGGARFDLEKSIEDPGIVDRREQRGLLGNEYGGEARIQLAARVPPDERGGAGAPMLLIRRLPKMDEPHQAQRQRLHGVGGLGCPRFTGDVQVSERGEDIGSRANDLRQPDGDVARGRRATAEERNLFVPQALAA